MSRRISIEPLTRIEGHGRIDITLDDAGDVSDVQLAIPELRGFERLCVGRPVEEMPRITSRICGVCPPAHHLASALALDAVFGVTPTAAAARLRELYYLAFMTADHLTHFYILAGPDLLLPADTPVAERSLVGVLRAFGPDFGKKLVEQRTRTFELITRLGGRAVHPVAALPGGWAHPASPETCALAVEVASGTLAFALETLALFERKVLGNKEFVDLMLSGEFTQRTYSMGMVDAGGRPVFLGGRLRVVDPEGDELVTFEPVEYQQHIAEHIEPWTYAKLPFLRSIGWAGYEDGPGSGILISSPLGRLNVADEMPTPRAQEAFEKMYETLSSRSANGRFLPVHHRLAIHWARLVELVQAAERMVDAASHPELGDPDVRRAVDGVPNEGVGCVEAPRGTLIHHYRTDPDGIVTAVNLIVGTTHNHAAMALTVKRAAAALISKGDVAQHVLDRIEMVFRAYDPCLACATHTAPGGFPLRVTVRDAAGSVVFEKQN